MTRLGYRRLDEALQGTWTAREFMPTFFCLHELQYERYATRGDKTQSTDNVQYSELAENGKFCL